RLQALGAAHNLLSDREWRGIGIHELVQIEAKPFDSAAQPRMTITGEDLLLTPDQAVGLGLILPCVFQPSSTLPVATDSEPYCRALLASSCRI
ncbi:HWE histidine kinase domain-containing protein, partial [Mesorhizobium sp. M2D.F.Ca.ET.185.01.1.1]|uniref:HWE histidine kinase domain-containing protein n=1 Tax=Mesorhizobium sp. M2D.F.Ca.ET.185.01.1.1 TaxID=2563938 RepID=UPI00247AD854